MKKIWIYIAVGFPCGIAITQVLTIIYSFFAPGSMYYPTTPELVTMVDHEIGAVLLQTILSGLLGSICFSSKLIFEMDEWSLTKQTVFHFILIYFSTLVIGALLHWLPWHWKGVLMYTGNVVVIYILIWFFLYQYYRIQINKINNKLVNNK